MHMQVSTKEQNPERQLKAFLDAGVKSQNIYLDKLSGASMERPQFQELLNIVKENDLIVFTDLERLGRNYNEILETWRYITQTKKVHVEIINMPILNTNQQDGILSEVISDIVLTLLAYVSNKELEDIKKSKLKG